MIIKKLSAICFINCIYVLLTVTECEFYASVIMSDVQTHTLYGAPEIIWIHYVVTTSGEHVQESGKDSLWVLFEGPLKGFVQMLKYTAYSYHR
jgi:hypothetical protein